MVKDVYNPNISNSNIGDKLSDRWLGTNNVHNKNMYNNYEFQKAINVNKFQWNKEGMVQAGINPLANSGGLNSMSSSQAQSDQGGDMGLILEEYADIFHQLKPSKVIQETRGLVKDILKSLK